MTIRGSLRKLLRTLGGDPRIDDSTAFLISKIADRVENIPSGSDSGGGDITGLLDKTISGEFSNADLTALGRYAFYECEQLTSISLPNVTIGEDSSFCRCTKLENVYVPKMNGADDYVEKVFQTCSSLKKIALPNWTRNIGTTFFSGCSSLEAVDLSTVSISSYSFSNCSTLNILVLRNTELVPLSYTNSFNGSPFASNGSGGTLYVPNDLISSYQSATNWSVILGYANNQIKSIESTHTDPNAPIDLTLYYADGTPIT